MEIEGAREKKITHTKIVNRQTIKDEKENKGSTKTTKGRC